MDDGHGHLYEIQADLTDTWLEEWADDGVAEVEAYLAKHAAFLTYLETREAA
ncbi:MAG TPA: hypothetical protein VGQ15_15235 [Gaiellaceae bacterium]|jgi:hypothetical protein|nr:hypothetical protein [Gaiellaceae bacterium]